jgi:ankyrin repeat protein
MRFQLIILIYSCIIFQIISEDETFFNSARIGDIKTLREFILNGTSVNARDSKGNTPIIIAAGRGHVSVISLLLEHGASVEDSTQLGLFEGKTVLSWASSQGRVQAVGLLLQAGADPNKIPNRGVFEGKTSLTWACSQGRTSVVRLLLAAGVDVNYSSKTGNFQVKYLIYTIFEYLIYHVYLNQ